MQFSQSPRRIRRQEHSRSQRKHSFSRSWSRALAAGAVLGLVHSAQAAPTATYVGTDGNYSTSGNFTSGGSTVVPDGSDGTFYAVSITGSDVTHDHSTGTGGVDTIASLTTDSNFYLSGGILAGSGANRSSLFAMNQGELFQLSGGATLRNFTVTGAPITMNGSGTLDNVTTGLQGTVFGTLTFANNTLATVGGDNALSLGNYNEGAETLTGAGTLALGDADGKGTLNVGQYDAGTIGAGTIVSGQGLGGTINGDNGASTLTNSGTIQADGGTLTVQNLGGFTNNLTLQAINGGTLNLNSSLTNTGLLTAANGSTINLNSITLTGSNNGSNDLVTDGTGLVNSNQSALVNVTTGAGTAIDVIGGRSNAFGTLTNNGTITVGTGDALGLGSYNDGTHTLAGTGTVALTGGSLNVGQYDAATIGAGQTVTATGTSASVINGDNGASTLTNSGTIQADGGTLTVQNLGGFTNNLTLQAINGGTLNLNSSLTNTGLFTAGAGSTINLNGINLTGTDGTTTGLLSTTGTGVVNSTTSNLTNVTTGAGTAINIIGGRSGVFGTFTNNGTITVGTGDALGLGSYNDGTHTLAGTGTVALTGGSLNVGQYDAATIGAGQTVTTTGTSASVINGDNGASTLANSGTIQADGGTLTVQNLTAGFTNAAGGLVQSINSGTFNLDNNVVGNLHVDGTSTFNLNGINASSGILSGPGAFTLFNASLSTETISTNLNLTAQDPNSNPVGNPIGNGTFYGVNTLTGGSVITVGGGNALNLGNYNEGAETLTGTGGVVLGNASGSGTLNIGQYDAGTLGTNVTVTTGSGRTGVINGDNGASTLANNGTIFAAGVGGALTIQGLNGGFTNAKILQAINGGTLNLDSNLVNTGFFTAANGSTINLNGINLTGTDGTTAGLLSTTGTGLVNSNQSALVNVTTGAGTAIDVIGGRSNAFGTLTNNGTITVGTGDALGLGSYNDGTHTLAGTGTVALTGGSLNVGQYDAGVIAAGATVSGSGVLNGDNGASTLANSGTIQASGGTLTVQNLGSITSTEGKFAATNGGTLNVSNNLTGGSTGTLTTDPTGTINLNNALTQDQGTSQVDGVVNMGSGNTLTVTGGTLKGSGTVNGNVTVTGGDVAPGDSPGTLAVGGDYTQTGGALDIEYTASLTQPTAHDLLTVSGTATLGGVLNISFLGPGVNGLYLAAAGEPGTTFDFLTFGTLGNASGLAGLFTNEYSVGSNYFVNGIPQDSVAGVPAQYRLTFDPNNGKALQLSLTTTATPEPSQWAAFGLGVLGLTGLGLRARRKTA